MRDNFLCTDQAFTTEAVSEHILDLEATGKQMGHAGKPLVVHFRVKTGFTGLDSGVHINITDSEAAALTSDRGLGQFGSATATDDCVIPVADLAAGAHLQFVIPPGIRLKRYVGLNWVPVSEAGATGVVDAWVDDKMEMAA